MHNRVKQQQGDWQEQYASYYDTAIIADDEYPSQKTLSNPLASSTATFTTTANHPHHQQTTPCHPSCKEQYADYYDTVIPHGTATPKYYKDHLVSKQNKRRQDGLSPFASVSFSTVVTDATITIATARAAMDKAQKNSHAAGGAIMIAANHHGHVKEQSIIETTQPEIMAQHHQQQHSQWQRHTTSLPAAATKTLHLKPPPATAEAAHHKKLPPHQQLSTGSQRKQSAPTKAPAVRPSAGATKTTTLTNRQHHPIRKAAPPSSVAAAASFKANNNIQEPRYLRSHDRGNSKWINDRRKLWSSIYITKDDKRYQSNAPHDGVACVAQCYLAAGTRLVDRKCPFHPNSEPPDPINQVSRALAAHGNYIKCGSGYFDIMPSLSEWINEVPNGGSSDQNNKTIHQVTPNLAFGIDYDNNGTPQLSWKVLQDINVGDELLVSYHSTNAPIIDLTDEVNNNHDNVHNNGRQTVPLLQFKVEGDELTLLDLKIEQRRKFMMTFKVATCPKLQCDPQGAGIVAQRDIHVSETFHDFFCEIPPGQWLDEDNTNESPQLRNTCIQAISGYFVLDNCWSEWINEARDPERQAANMKFRIRRDDPSPLNNYKSIPILEWCITQTVLKGQEVLVSSYWDPIESYGGLPAIYVVDTY